MAVSRLNRMNKPPIYIAYLLRLWRVEGWQAPVWHASLEDLHTGKRRGFASLESLFAFLEGQTGDDRSRSALDESAH